MKYHLKARNSDNAHCGAKASPAAFIYTLEQFNAYFNAELKCKRCKKAASAIVKPSSKLIILLTKPGFDASIETDIGIFHLRSTYQTETNLTSIDIYNQEGKFLDEFASGFGISYDLSDTDNLKNLVLIADYIVENIIL
jgi:hypothetical protein